MGLIGKFTIVFMLLSSNFVIAQKDSVIAKNTIFVEGLGNGIIGSLNYDRLVYINNAKFSCRLGFVYLPMKNNKSPFSIPVEFNFLKGQKNHFESGLGFTYAYAFNSSNRYISHGSNFITIQEFSKALYIVVKPIAYRFQKTTGGMFIKISGFVLYKAIEFNDNYIKRDNEFIIGPYMGASLGYTF